MSPSSAVLLPRELLDQETPQILEEEEEVANRGQNEWQVLMKSPHSHFVKFISLYHARYHKIMHSEIISFPHNIGIEIN